MTLRKRRRTAMMILLAGVVLALLGTDTGWIWLTVPGMTLLLGGLALDAAWVRCPRCGRWLGWNTSARCPACGTEISWD